MWLFSYWNYLIWLFSEFYFDKGTALALILWCRYFKDFPRGQNWLRSFKQNQSLKAEVMFWLKPIVCFASPSLCPLYFKGFKLSSAMTSWKYTTAPTCSLLWLARLMEPRSLSSCLVAAIFCICSSPPITVDQTVDSRYYLKVSVCYYWCEHCRAVMNANHSHFCSFHIIL